MDDEKYSIPIADGLNALLNEQSEKSLDERAENAATSLSKKGGVPQHMHNGPHNESNKKRKIAQLTD